MPTIRILDHYRSTILDNKELFRVLSIMFRESTILEDELLRKSDLSEKKQKKVLNQLYKANLAKLVSPNKWSTTELADEVLTNLGISELSAISYITDQPIPDEDKEFLKACLESRSKNDKEWSRNINALLRALNLTLQWVPEAESRDNKFRSRVLYAIVVGSDLEMASLEPETYCRTIFNLHSHKDSNFSKTQLTFELINKHFAPTCAKAFEDYESSNKFLITGDERWGRASLVLTHARLLSNITESRDTCRITSLYNMDREIYSRACEKIFLLLPSVESRTLERFTEHRARYPAIPASSLKGLLRREFVRRLENTSKKVTEGLINFSTKIEMYPSSSEGAHLACLDNIEQGLDSGIFDDLSKKHKVVMSQKLARLNDKAKERFFNQKANK